MYWKLLQRGWTYKADDGGAEGGSDGASGGDDPGGGGGDPGDGGTGGGAGGSSDELPGYMEQFSGDLKTDGFFKPYQSLSDLGEAFKGSAQELITLKEKLGTAIIAPGDDATDEEIATYNKALGVPESAADYEFDKIELPEGMKVEKADLDKYGEIFKRSGLPKGAAQAAMSEILKEAQAGGEEAAKAEADAKAETESIRKGNTDKLNEAWGRDSDAKTESAKRALKVFAEKTPFDAADVEAAVTELQKSPMMLAMFGAVADAIDDDVFLYSAGGGGDGGGDKRPTTKSGSKRFRYAAEK